jgi:serine/threonine protein kinase
LEIRKALVVSRNEGKIARLSIMNTDDWRKVNEIVADVLDMDPGSRRKYLKEAIPSNSEIEREVLSLLDGEIEADDLFGSPAVANFADLLTSEEAPEALAGQTLGNYKIIREIGWGGMGAVYLAERTDGVFEQNVALKLLKREFNTSALRRYFQQERAILAALQHPNIARLLDAGTTDDKVPFIVMEYVDGLPIDEYCSVNDLSLSERLDLFRDVCTAVDFAHRSLIIHRDLKPSNILVTADGTVKLLDFGISKILSENTEDNGSRTITRLGVMTPSYASPEQLKNESVTTATDVYSLGVILYELLCGVLPFEGRKSDVFDTGKFALEAEPPLPSSVVSGFTVDGVPELSHSPRETDRGHIRTTSPRIRAVKAQQLRGDLDNIMTKALRHEPERRYASVAKFSEDIGRYQSGFPVEARPDTFRYRAHKFMSRNVTGVAAAALVTIAILSGIGATLWQSRVAAAERDRARQEADKAQKINAYLQNVLNFSNPHWLSSNPKRNRDATIAQAMDEALKTIDTDLAGDPEIQAEILFTLCQSYATQGDFSKSNSLALRAIEKFDEALGPGNVRSMQASVILADTQYLSGQFDEAEANYLKAIDYFRERYPTDPTAIKWLTIALNDQGNVDIIRGKFQIATERIRESVSLAEQITGRDRYVLPTVLTNLATALQYLNDYEGSAEYSARSLAVMREQGSDQKLEGGIAHLTIGKAQNMIGNYELAAQHLELADQIFTSSVGDDNAYTLNNRYHKANNLFKRGQTAESLVLIEETISRQKALFPKGHFSLCFSQRLLGEILTKQGKLKDGEQELRTALDFMAASVSEPNHEISFIKTTLGENLIAQNRAAEALDVLNSALNGFLSTRGDNNFFTDRCRELIRAAKVKLAA